MNTTLASPADDEHLLRCWRIQNCKDCLTQQPDCSWCPFSWTCVPNSNRVPFLAPARDGNVCPHWAERWEIRTRPLGCQVSTITTLTSLVSIASTLVFVLLVTLAVFGIKKVRAYGKAHPGWWRIWRYNWRRWGLSWQEWFRARLGRKNHAGDREANGEQEPLLRS
ncbi:hypothetical protein F4677DRAFT_246682 [Hypoxylon crocopeplum]|nr:hypothetical protein F4677DRAFT_246682 [Hypoxylon crocopeplum]